MIRHRIAPLLAFAAIAAPPTADADRVSDYISAALQGDLARAGAVFDGVADADLTSDERALRDQFLARFVRRDEVLPPVSDDPFVEDIVATYRDYWTRSLRGMLPEAEGEAWLERSVRDVFHRHDVAADVADDELLDHLDNVIEGRGLFHLGGVTLPYRELALWTVQDTAAYEVQLTDGPQSVTVVFLDGFLVRGWAHWATFGRASSGGWTTKEALFCLRDSYDLASENFLVSYLAHEGRHFADYSSFPALEQIDLEYRAKLTELAYAEESLVRLLGHFVSAGSLNERAPHAYANECVVRNLSREIFDEDRVADRARWTEVPADRIHEVARKLLLAHDAALQAAGARTTTGVLRTLTGAG